MGCCTANDSKDNDQIINKENKEHKGQYSLSIIQYTPKRVIKEELLTIESKENLEIVCSPKHIDTTKNEENKIFLIDDYVDIKPANTENLESPRSYKKKKKKKRSTLVSELSANTQLSELAFDNRMSINTKSVDSRNDNFLKDTINLEDFNEVKHVLFLVYPPGTNKDEAIYPYLKPYDFEKISIKSLIYEDGLSHKQFSSRIQKYLDEKKEVPEDIVVYLLFDKIFNSKNNRFLISGFPKTESNSKTWKRIIKNKIKVIGLVQLTYTRNEYITELNERLEKYGERMSIREGMEKFDFFLKNTNQVYDDFGKNNCLRISAKVPDKSIADMIIKSDLLRKISL